MFLKRQDPYRLLVGIVGVKLGDRLLQIGCAHGGRLGAIAGKVGLSGRAVAVVADEASAARARHGAAEAGVLVEIEMASPARLAFDPDSFDLVVFDDTGGHLASMPPDNRRTAAAEALRVLRPGGRAMVIGAGPRAGLSKLFGGGGSAPVADAPATASTLESAGFKLVRNLAEREGLVFVEGVKPRAE
jgi:SAM-dependent methyltransferase